MLTKLNWEKGIFNFTIKNEKRICIRHDCGKEFVVKPSDPKLYCSRRCFALVNNIGRVLSDVVKAKISRALTGRKAPRQSKKIPVYRICLNCGREFLVRYWRPASRPVKYCGNKCAMAVIGGQPTSPRAARAKAGIRLDIDPSTYFYSRWEANYARILNLNKIKWIHQPKRFRLESQYYTPDFYLPKTNTYIEIKNFLAEYSRKRDEQFRKLYPEEKLILILKDDYKKLENKYAPMIKEWEFSK